MPANEMIEIDTHAMIGKGLHRECFVHPEDSNLCVKIVVAGKSDENRREASYYTRLDRRGVSWEMLPRFHGLVQTNLGEGAIFDLVRDYDGPVSHTLAHYLASKRLTAEHATVLRPALANLKSYLLQNRIITMTLKPKNILFQQYAAGEGRLVIVDNIGNSDFIPLANHSKWLARRKIQRKWRRFEANLRIIDWSGFSARDNAVRIRGRIVSKRILAWPAKSMNIIIIALFEKGKIQSLKFGLAAIQ